MNGFVRLIQGESHYVRPELHEDGPIVIEDGRHPVLDSYLKRNHLNYKPNSTVLSKDSSLLLLSGPNMSGKTTYMKQVDTFSDLVSSEYLSLLFCFFYLFIYQEKKKRDSSNCTYSPIFT